MTASQLTSSPGQPLRAARLLEFALLFTIVAHGTAMLSMALCLLPGIPGGTLGPDVPEPHSAAAILSRAIYIAEHPWRWRLGWMPWQITALSDLLLSWALLRSHWIPKTPARVAFILTVAAVLAEQPHEFLWVTEGVQLARETARTHLIGDFERFESRIYEWVSLWAACGYTLSAVAWSVAFARAGTWHRGLTALSIVAWPIFFAYAIGPLVWPSAACFSPLAIAIANAVGFVLLMCWFVLVTEFVLRRSRPHADSGRMAVWRSPHRGIVGCVSNVLANSRCLRAIGEWLPSLEFHSDITHVVYVNYVVPADSVLKFVPPGLQLQRLGPDGRFALFTFLTYRHGHFGPRCLGPLRRLLPSPIQSNWRIHVFDPRTKKAGITFLTTAISSTLNALGARHLSEGVAMHVPERAVLNVSSQGEIDLQLDPGSGSSPDVRASLRPGPVPEFEADWRACFGTFDEFLQYCVPQDRALDAQPWYARVSRSEIELGIPLSDCRPLQGTVESQAATANAGASQPICFYVPQVRFRYCGDFFD